MMICVGEAEVFCGSGVQGFAMGNRLTAAFIKPGGAVRDPINPTGWYIFDDASIRHFDEATDVVTLVIGDWGPSLSIGRINSMLITSDGQTIWFGEIRGDLQRVDIATRRVVRAVYSSWVSALVWDRAPTQTAKPDSAFYCIVSEVMIHRFDTATRNLTPCPKLTLGSSSSCPTSMICTDSGHLIVTVHDEESDACVVVAYDPITAAVERLDYMEVDLSSRLVLIDSTRTLIARNPHRAASAVISAYTLPPHYFRLPRCCDRDL